MVERRHVHSSTDTYIAVYIPGMRLSHIYIYVQWNEDKYIVVRTHSSIYTWHASLLRHCRERLQVSREAPTPRPLGLLRRFLCLCRKACRKELPF